MKLLHANVLGDSGWPLIILHGFLGSGDNWKTLGKRFAFLGYQVHILDQRNHGKSFHDSLFNYDALADDINAYCVYHKLQKISILGHSMGGKVAMTFSLKYPELLKQLIVADIAPRYYPAHHDTILKGLKAIDFDQISSRQEADIALSAYVPEATTRQFLLKNLHWVDSSKLGWRMNLKVLSDNIERIGEALPANSPVNCPSLFLRGSKSNYIGSDDELWIHKQFKNTAIQEIKNAGHWLHAENPNDFFDAVSLFLLKNK